MFHIVSDNVCTLRTQSNRPHSPPPSGALHARSYLQRHSFLNTPPWPWLTFRTFTTRCITVRTAPLAWLHRVPTRPGPRAESPSECSASRLSYDARNRRRTTFGRRCDSPEVTKPRPPAASKPPGCSRRAASGELVAFRSRSASTGCRVVRALVRTPRRARPPS